MPYADLFGHRDLDRVDVIAVPQGFEDGVGKAREQDVLHGLFAQVMVDAIDLVFDDHFVQLQVEFPGGSQVGTEGLFDHDASPAAVFLELVGSIQVRNDGRENAGRDGHVIQAVSTTLFECIQEGGKLFEPGLVVVFSLLVVQMGRKQGPFFFCVLVTGVFL